MTDSIFHNEVILPQNPHYLPDIFEYNQISRNQQFNIRQFLANGLGLFPIKTGKNSFWIKHEKTNCIVADFNGCLVFIGPTRDIYKNRLPTGYCWYCNKYGDL